MRINLFKYTFTVLLVIVSFAGCNLTQKEEPVYLEGNYYGEVIYNSTYNAIHKMNQKVKIVLNRHLEQVIISFSFDNFSTSETMSFDFDTNRGEVNLTGNSTGLQSTGWIIVDGYKTRGEFRRYDMGNNHELLTEIIWDCSK